MSSFVALFASSKADVSESFVSAAALQRRHDRRDRRLPGRDRGAEAHRPTRTCVGWSFLPQPAARRAAVATSDRCEGSRSHAPRIRQREATGRRGVGSQAMTAADPARPQRRRPRRRAGDRRRLSRRSRRRAAVGSRRPCGGSAATAPRQTSPARRRPRRRAHRAGGDRHGAVARGHAPRPRSGSASSSGSPGARPRAASRSTRSRSR